MKTFKIFSMAALALVMAACSNEDNAIEQQPAQQLSRIPFSATIAAPNSSATTRTTYTPGKNEQEQDIINVAWRAKVDGGYEGDKIALIHGGKLDVVTVTSVNDDGRAVIEGTIQTPTSDEEDVVLVYPAATVESATPQDPLPYTPSETYVAKGFSQDGTLEYIQNNLDGRQGTGTLKKVSGKATLKEDVSMPSKIVIWKLSLKDIPVTATTAPNALSATSVNIKVGSATNVVAAASSTTAKSEYYLCLVPATMGTGDLTIEAKNGTNTYSYTKAGGATLTAGCYYQSTVSMYTLGYVICTNGSIYPTASAAREAGSIPVGKIVYLGNNTGHTTCKNGLALSLIDVGFNESYDLAITYCSYLNSNQSTAYSTFNGTNVTALTGAEWMLPTKDQWETMISAAGGFANLRDGFASVGGTNMRTTDGTESENPGTPSYYWSSTEVSGKTWWYSIKSQSGSWADDSAHECYVRACLAF